MLFIQFVDLESVFGSVFVDEQTYFSQSTPVFKLFDCYNQIFSKIKNDSFVCV